MYLMSKIVDKKLEKWFEKYGDLSPEVKIKLKRLMNELKTNNCVQKRIFSLHLESIFTKYQPQRCLFAGVE